MTAGSTVCMECRKAVRLSDWTCPHCGAILDKYLFGTVTQKSLDAQGRIAFQAGFDGCMRQAAEKGSSAIAASQYHPPAGYETAYRAGWQQAADRILGRASRKIGRKRGLKVLGSGILLLLLGGGIMLGTGALTGGRISLLWLTPFGLGAINVVIGIVMFLTGDSDEPKPL